MIKFRGRGEAPSLFTRVEHHAAGVAHLVAPIAVLLLDVLGRDDEVHELHVGSGWTSVHLTLANGEKVALRAMKTNRRYDHIEVRRGSFTPLGEMQFVVRDEQGVDRLRRALRRWGNLA